MSSQTDLLKQHATTIKNEVADGANTATRVGGAILEAAQILETQETEDANLDQKIKKSIKHYITPQDVAVNVNNAIVEMYLPNINIDNIARISYFVARSNAGFYENYFVIRSASGILVTFVDERFNSYDEAFAKFPSFIEKDGNYIILDKSKLTISSVVNCYCSANGICKEISFNPTIYAKIQNDKNKTNYTNDSRANTILEELYIGESGNEDLNRIVISCGRTNGTKYENFFRIVKSDGTNFVLINHSYNTRAEAIAAWENKIVSENGVSFAINLAELGEGLFDARNIVFNNVCCSLDFNPKISTARLNVVVPTKKDITKFTDSNAMNLIVSELYQRQGLMAGDTLSIVDNSGTALLRIDRGTQLIAALSPVRFDFVGLLRLGERNNSGVSPYLCVDMTKFPFEVGLGLFVRGNINAEVCANPSNSPVSYNESTKLSVATEPTIKTENYQVASVVDFTEEEVEKTELFAHNQNCDFDIHGNCVLSYAYYVDSAGEDTPHANDRGVKIVKFNPASGKKEILHIQKNAGGQFVMPYFHDNEIRIIYQDSNSNLFVKDSSWNDLGEMTISYGSVSKAPLNMTSYNACVVSYFDNSGQNFELENNFSLQTKIIKVADKWYMLLNGFRGDSFETYKVPMLLSSIDGLDWQPILLVRDSDGYYLKCKGESCLASDGVNLYMALRGGQRTTEPNKTIGTTIVEYSFPALSINSVATKVETLPMATELETKPFIGIVGSRVIVLYNAGEVIYDDYNRNVLTVYDYTADKALTKLSRSGGFHYASGSAIKGALLITFVEDIRGMYKIAEGADGKYSDIGFARISID